MAKIKDLSKIEPPKHIALIMDGNGRWAKKRFMPKFMGHKWGAEAARKTLRGAINQGIQYLTLYAFSTENWERPKDEVNDIMGLMRYYLTKEAQILYDLDVRIIIIGNRDRFADDLQELFAELEENTKTHKTITVQVAVGYGGRAEILSAVKRIVSEVSDGTLDSDAVDEDAISSRLYTAGVPDPDLVIRTSGEHRLSNFLMWQLAYAEFLFMDLLWPDFDESNLIEAIEIYKKRDRRYGGRP